MQSSADLGPGDPDRIADYRVLGRLGAGGQGVVYLGEAPSGQRVAIKKLLTHFDTEQTRQQFAKEVFAAERVAPFCTAQVLHVELEGPAPYVVSEYIEGETLQQRVNDGGPITGTALHRLAIGTATALTAIHQAGVVHRDFKPANVMLGADGPRVIDFGIARALSTEVTDTSRVVGTPAYMAPEQLRGEQAGPATDMFAWASVIAYAATGRTLFQAPSVMAVMHRIVGAEPDLSDLPDDLRPVLRNCLEKNPDRRPSAQQVLAMLLGRSTPEHDAADAAPVLAEAADLLQASPPKLLPAGARPVPAPNPRFEFRPLALIAGAVVLLLLGGAWVADVRPWDSSSSSSLTPVIPTDTATTAASAVATGTATGTPPPTASLRAPTTSPTRTSARTAKQAPAGGASPRRSSESAGDEEPDDEPAPDAVEGDGDGTNPIPLKFRGFWEGSFDLSSGTSTTVNGQSDDVAGNIVLSMPKLACGGFMDFDHATADALYLDARITYDPDDNCDQFGHGVVTWSLQSKNTLVMVWQEAANPDQTVFNTELSKS
jgi:serine/threonine protein kinase